MSEKQRILLVDDDPNISHLVRLYLEKEGFDVTESARGDEALEAFRRESPALVLLDVMLPGMDGLQVLQGDPQDQQGARHHAHRRATKPSTRCWGWNWARTIM